MSILDIQQVSKGQESDSFGLFSGTTRLSKQIIGSCHLLETLLHGKKETAKLMKVAEDKAEEALSSQANSHVIVCENTKIVNEFRLVKGTDCIELDLDGFNIHDTYLPDDDKAPDRIHGIVKEFRDVILDMFRAKNQVLEDNADECRHNIYTTCKSDTGKVILGKMVNGKAIPYTKDTISVKEVVQTIHFYKIKYPGLIQAEYVKKHVSSSGKKHLKGLVLSVEEGAVKVHNLKDYSSEVQDVIGDMIGYFTLAK